MYQQSTFNRGVATILCIVVAAVTFNACKKVTGEGPVVVENRGSNNFNAVSVRVSGTVYFRQDSVYRLEIKAQQNIINLIETTVVNNELTLRFRNNTNVRSHEGIVINITAPSINAIDISGSADIYADGRFTPADCKLQISGSGNIIMDELLTNNLDANISGSGNIRVLNGIANHQSLRISGSGSMDMLNLLAKSANSSSSGSGTVKVNLSERLEVHISGSGNVYYKGKPQVSASVSGSGKVIAL